MPRQVLLLFLPVFLACFFGGCDGHVALTYPPGRKFDLDFLDNARTAAPCGMPKGDIKTSIIQGSKLNITWHLGYPHQGGFLLELLDKNEQHQMFLTPNEENYIADDTTAQYFLLNVPKDLVCEDCTIRLLRQALEWGFTYRFWSCADVDILPRTRVTRDCNGRGRYIANRCLCNKRFFGSECQYEDECEKDEDCGRLGTCVDLEATNYPKKQCFCSTGTYGPKCSLSSVIKSETQVNLGVYTSRNLSDTLTLYWKVLRREEEIEVVLINKGTSYVALGWRSPSTTKQCREFPKIIGKPPPAKLDRPEISYPRVKKKTAEKEQTVAEPEAESEPETKTEPKGEIKSEPEAKPEAESEPEPEAEPEAEPKPEGDSQSGSLHRGRTVATRTSVHDKDEPENKPKLSLADRLAQFSGRKKRSPQDVITEKRKFRHNFASPLLKTSSSVSKDEETKNENADTNAEPEPEPKAEPESEPKAEPEAESEAEPEAESEAEPEAESEAEPEAESEAEPEAESEAEPEAESEAEPEAESEAEPEPESEPASEKKSDGSSTKNPYTPKGATLHPMDCTDVVVGMARGNFYRVTDMYTRDRSTPRSDEFWGGENSLTAAFGWERDGETTILFRKKLRATHETDHSIEEGLMHVIWAKGQEHDMYVHVPKSGLEAGTASIKDFYRPDELKYHGRRDQRGVTTVDFYEQKSNLNQADGDKINWCGGQWKYPHSCSVADKNCEYYARWEFIEATDVIQFTVISSNTNLWTGIGFSDDGRMSKTDVVLGWMTPAGKYFMYDGWLQSYTPPRVDSKQGISNLSASQEDGITTLNFARKRQSDDDQDLSFTDDKCLYLVFPVKGGTVNFKNKRISKHNLTPTLSSTRICIRSCAKFGDADGKPIVFTTTPKPPQMIYNVEFKITNPGENLATLEPGSPGYNNLANQVLQNVEGVFEKLPGYVVADVVDFDGSEASKVKTTIRVTLDKGSYEALSGVIQNEEDQKMADEKIFNMIEESVKTGRIGQLAVEPNFLKVDSLKVDFLSEAKGKKLMEAEDDDSDSIHALQFIDQHKYWFIGAGIVALIVLALLQGIITTCRKKTNTPPPVSTKERLITNSRWKDYSRGTNNYAYETYENNAEGRRVHSLRRVEPTYSSKRPPSNGHPQNGPPSDMGYAESRSGVGYPPDTRSLQRPKNPPILSDPRTTYSLPRGASATSSPPSYTSAMQDLTPDFYYLPSQRKYSGEVVRVYVDYNEAK